MRKDDVAENVHMSVYRYTGVSLSVDTVSLGITKREIGLCTTWITLQAATASHVRLPDAYDAVLM